MQTEKSTDFLVHDLLKAAGIDAKPNKIQIAEIDGALKTASKKGTGQIGRPEFLAVSGGYLLVVEDKADPKFQAKFVEGETGTSLLMDPSSVVAYAENGALHYATHIARQTSFKEVFAFGCSGTEEGRLTIRPIFVTPSGYKLLPRIQNFSDYSPRKIKKTHDQKVLSKKPLETVELEEIMKRAGSLHEDLRNYGNLGETEKPIVVSAILLALCEDGFTTETLTGDAVKKDGEKIFEALSTHLDRVHVEPEVKKKQVLDQFRFIATRPALSEIHPNLGKSPLRYFAEYLHSNILGAINNNSPEDVLGRFYGEFIRYSGGDGQSLGVVLTPKHITSLFADLAQVGPDDKVFDPCCGTAGFLVAAMHRMMALTTTEYERARIRRDALHGIEMRDDMFSIATTNMILRGDGKSNLVCADFLKKDSAALREKGFTVGLMNPPYSQAKNKGTSNLSELRFICHLLDSLAEGGRAVVIVPQSAMVGSKTRQDALDKRYILDHHTLEGVITLNTQTFGRVGTNPVIAVFTAHHPHSADKLVKFIDFRDDGYKVFPHLGLLPTADAPARRKRLLDCWLQGKSEPAAFVVHTPVTAEDEWLHSYFYFNDEIPSDSDFEEAMADYLTFEFNMIAHGRGYLFEKVPPAKTAGSTEKDTSLSNWCAFPLENIFEISPGVRLTKADMKPGKTPFAGASDSNNGITAFVANRNESLDRDVLGVNYNGSVGESFYHPYETVFSDDVKRLRVKGHPGGRHVYLFLKVAILKQAAKYQYGYKFNEEHMRRQSLFLPSTPDGAPDFAGMEAFMRHKEAEQIARYAGIRLQDHITKCAVS